MADSHLSAMLGTDCARRIHEALPRIENQLRQGSKTATVSVSFIFMQKKGELMVEMRGNDKFVAPVQQRKLLAGSDGQLRLFEDS